MLLDGSAAIGIREVTEADRVSCTVSSADNLAPMTMPHANISVLVSE